MKLIAIVGPTCSGKTTLANILRDKYNIPRRLTYTTRPPRNGEKDGEDYYFVSESWFMSHINEFDETQGYEVASGEKWWYGSILYDGRRDLKVPLETIILTPKGFKAVKDKLGGIVYVKAHPFTRYGRGLKRGDDPAELARRIGMESYDFEDFEQHLDRNFKAIKLVTDSGYIDYGTIAQYLQRL